MADDLKNLSDDVNNIITDAGGPESIEATEDNGLRQQFLNKIGKYSSLFFTAELGISELPSGNFSWEGNKMNETNSFSFVISRLSADNQDMKILLEGLGGKTYLKLKDFRGRSGLYIYESHVDETDTNNSDVIRVFCKGLVSNSNYTYQANEALTIGLDIISINANATPYGQLKWFKSEANQNGNLNAIEAGDTVMGQLNNGVFMPRGVYVAGDEMEYTSYDDDSDFYDSNDIIP